MEIASGNPVSGQSGGFAAAGRPSAAAGDHQLGTFCHHVCHTSISCFWSSGGQYGSLGADFSAAGSRGVNRVADVFLGDNGGACSPHDVKEGSMMQVISDIFARFFLVQTKRNRFSCSMHAATSFF